MTELKRKGSILVVEDDLALRSVICRYLGGEGYQVTEAFDGDKAIEALERAPFDFVLTDIIMPNREGIETIIETHARWPETKIVAMSGGGRIGPGTFLQLAQDFGADAILKKPFRFSELIETLEQLKLGGAAFKTETSPEIESRSASSA